MSTGSLEGSTIGRFRVGRLLGRGGMGAVYSAFDEKLERDVALKVLHEGGESNLQRKRLLREARIAAKLQHPNIATIYEVEEQDGNLTIVMELLEGQSLRKALLERRLGTEEAIAIARDMARGLARAHTAGVVHRDIKPENVFLTQLSPETMITKVLDFGLARQKPQPTPTLSRNDEHTTTDTTTRGDMWGTPGYVSPEQALGQQVDLRTDLFSFGVVFYEMLASVRPFRGDTAVATMIATTRVEPQPLRELVSDLPPAIDDIVRRCMMKKREDRYEDAAGLSAAFEAFARGGAPVSQRAPPVSQRVPPVGSRPSYPQADVAPVHAVVTGAGEASTTGSAAISSMTMREESLAAIEEQRRDRMKLAVLVGAGLGLALTVLVLGVTFAASRAHAGPTAIDSARAAAPPPPALANAPEPEPEPSSEPAPTLEVPEVAAAASDSAAPPTPPAGVPAPHPHATNPPAPAGSGKKKGVDCSEKFTRDKKGVKIPKLECL